MVKEFVKLYWEDIGVHLPPEFPLPLEERIGYLVPGWEIHRKDNDVTSIRSKEKNASVTSSSKETICYCVGNYGENLESLKTVGKVIKIIGEFSKRKDIKRKLVENDCEVEITYDAVPLPDPNFVKNLNINLVSEETNVTKFCYVNKFYNFLDRYKFDFSRMFIFQDSFMINEKI